MFVRSFVRSFIVKSYSKQIPKRTEELSSSVANSHSRLLQKTPKKFVRPLFMWWNIVPIDTGINKSGTLHCRQWHSRPLLFGLLAGRWRHYMTHFLDGGRERHKPTQVCWRLNMQKFIKCSKHSQKLWQHCITCSMVYKGQPIRVKKWD